MFSWAPGSEESRQRAVKLWKNLGVIGGFGNDSELEKNVEGQLPSTLFAAVRDFSFQTRNVQITENAEGSRR